LQDGSLVILHVNGSDDGEYSCVANLNGGRVKLQSYNIIAVSADNQRNG